MDIIIPNQWFEFLAAKGIFWVFLSLLVSFLAIFKGSGWFVEGATKKLGISVSAANTLANSLEKAGILKEVTGFSRNRVFILHEYVALFER